MMARTALDEKVRQVFEDRVVDKALTRWNEAYKDFPRYVMEFLCARYVDPDNPGPGQRRIDGLLAEHYVDSGERELVRSKIKESSVYSLMGELRVRLDEAKDHYWAEVPALGSNHVRVSAVVLNQYGDLLLSSGAWGSMAVEYDASYEIKGRKYPFFIEFRPFQVTRLTLDDYVGKRGLFTDDEWRDLLIQSIGFNPMRLSDREKWLILVRLVPFVESNQPHRTGAARDRKDVHVSEYFQSLVRHIRWNYVPCHALLQPEHAKDRYRRPEKRRLLR